MKIIKIDKKIKEIIVIPETLDDLWHLEKIIEIDDRIFGKTDRKIKPSKEGEKTIRETIFVEIQLEKIQFQEYSENLKATGIILGGKPENLIELKAHQSIDVRIGDKLKIFKNEIKNWHIDRLKKAENESVTNKLLLVLLDDEIAELAFINQFTINKKAKIKSNKSGKMYKEVKNNYFEKILEKMLMLEPKKMLLAGPGFTKDNFKKFIENSNKKIPKIITETLNDVGETGFRELIKSGKLEGIEKELQLSKEGKVIEEFMEALPKEKGIYGLDEIKQTINQGLVKKIIVSETKLLEERKTTEAIMDLADNMNVEVDIISSKNPQEKTIYNFGGIVGILHYRR